MGIKYIGIDWHLFGMGSGGFSNWSQFVYYNFYCTPHSWHSRTLMCFTGVRDHASPEKCQSLRLEVVLSGLIKAQISSFLRGFWREGAHCIIRLGWLSHPSGDDIPSREQYGHSADPNKLFRVSRPLWVFFYDLLLFIMEVNLLLHHLMIKG